MKDFDMPRLRELLSRLVAPGRKASHLFASELHEIAEDGHAALDELSLARTEIIRLTEEIGKALNTLQASHSEHFRRGMRRAAEIVQKYAHADSRIVHDETETDHGPIEALHSLILDMADNTTEADARCDVVAELERLRKFEKRIRYRLGYASDALGYAVRCAVEELDEAAAKKEPS